MENGSDLSHTVRLIEKYTADAKNARQQARTQRARAMQNDSGNAAYFEQEALRDDHHADELEDHIDQLQSQKNHFEVRVKELENQRAHVDREHQDRLNQLDKEIASVRGSGMML